MSVENYYKSHGFKLINIDVFFSTLSVFAMLFVIPIIFEIGPLKPIKEAIADFNITDVYFSKILPDTDPPRETDIVIVNTGVNTKNGFKELSDVNYAQIVNKILPEAPSVIGIDHEFTISEDNPKYEIIAQIFSQSEDIIFSSKFDAEEGENTFVNQFATGFEEVLLVENKKYNSVRAFNPYFIRNQDTIYNYAVELARIYNPDAVIRFLKRKNEKETINYLGDWQQYDIINATQLFKGDYPEDFFTDKIVMLGVVDTSAASDEFARMYYTPLNETTAGKTFPDMYEIVLHANIVSMLLTDEYFFTSPIWLAPLVAFVICYFNMILFGYVGYKNAKWYEIVALGTFVAETLFIAWLTIVLFYSYRFELNLTLTIIAAAVSIPVFELYTDTFKPTILFAFNFIFKRNKKLA